jgi:hypothetical protein
VLPRSPSSAVYEASSGDTPYPYDFIGIYADPTVSTGIAHPFAVAFDSSNNGYVSSQDTNVVTLLPPYPLATPPSLAVASYLQTTYPNPPNNPFLPGTFVASCYGALNGVSPSPPNVPQPQGLDIDPPTGPAQNSVRDVLINNGLLYVADEPGNAVNIYYLTDQPPKTQGQLQGQITNTNLQSPTHLLANDGGLYIACSDCILACVLGGTAVATFLTGLTSPTGMAFDSNSNFFFTDRKDQCIYQSAYDSEKKQYNPPAVFIPAYDKKHAPDGLKDEPEFLLYVESA